LANLRGSAILRYASRSLFRCSPDFAGLSGYPSIAAASINARIDAMGQKATKCIAVRNSLFDHLVGAAKKWKRDDKPQRLCGL
jgi:hypothetical protein